MIDNDPGRCLSEARQHLVKRRWLVIKSLAASSNHEEMEAHMMMIVKIQNALDVVDRVSHEEHLPTEDETESGPGRQPIHAA